MNNVMHFKKLRYKNLLSSGNYWTELNLEESKSTLVIGANGSGKSTFLDALAFVLYGKPFRKINKPQLINSINQKNAEVQIEFRANSKDYLIKRGIKPTIFEIWENGEMINQDASIRDYQEYLEKNILKRSYSSFCQIDVLGSTTFVPFMQLTPAARREVIEDLLDLQIFSTMNTILKERNQENRNAINNSKHEIEMNLEKTKIFHQQIKEMQVLKDSEIQEKKDRISGLEEQNRILGLEIDEVLKEIDNVEAELIEVRKNEKARDKLNSMQKKAVETMNSLSREINFYENNDNCPTCKQDITEDFKTNKTENLSKRLSEFQKGMVLLEAKIERANKFLEKIEELQSRISTNQSKIRKMNIDITVNNSTIKSLHDDIKKKATENNHEQAEKAISTLNSEIVTLNSEHKELMKTKNIIKKVNFLLKDGGIKSRIINQYIPIFNKLVNGFLKKMDMFVHFEIDQNFSETIKSRHRDIFSYASFSEGEKMRIDLAILFTWRSIAKMRHSVSSNMLIMDEVFDSSLDETGIDELISIINDLTDDTNIFIISHKGDILFDKFSNTIKFEKKNDFSKIVGR